MPPKKANEALGKRIAAARHAKGWSIREAAERIGIDHSYLIKIEQGVYLSPKKIDPIARTLGIPLSELRALAARGPLPELRPYLRAKYGLSAEAAEELEAHFRELRRRDKGGST